MTVAARSGVAPTSRPASRIDLGRLGRAAGAWALGAFGVVDALAPNGSNAQAGAARLAAAGLVWVVALTWWPRRRVAAGAAMAATAAAGALLSVPLVGRMPLVVALVATTAAFAAVVEWRPTATTPQRSTPVAGWSVPPIVAAGLVWGRTQSVPATAMLLLVSLALTELLARRPALFAPASAATQRLERVAVAAATTGGRLMQRTIGSVTPARWTHRSPSRRRWRDRRPRDRADRYVIGAMIAGGALRLLWVVTKTADPSPVGSSPIIGDWYSTMNLRIATQFSHGQTPSFGGIATAIWPVGYGAFLTPLAWLSRVTGWFDLNVAACVVNALLGTITVGLVAAIGRRWLSPVAGAAAAWVLALAPSHVFATSVAVTEVFIAALAVGTVYLVSRLVHRASEPASLRHWAGVGAVIGFSMLSGDRAILLFVVPAFALRARSGTWRGALRTTAAVVAGAVIVVAPWTIRNGLEVDWWSPTATSIPEGMCTTKYEFGQELTTVGRDDPKLIQLAEDCFRNSPFDNEDLDLDSYFPPDWEWGGPDEGAQARRNSSGAIRWIVEHPFALLSHLPERLREVAGNDETGALEYASHFGRIELASPATMDLFTDLANAWYYLVLGLAAIGLVASPRVRRAIPLWYLPVGVALQPLLGPYGFSRHFFVGYPFLAVLAGGCIAAAVLGGRQMAATPNFGAPDRVRHHDPDVDHAPTASRKED